MFHFSLIFSLSSWIFKFCPLSHMMSASRFLSPKVGEFMRLSRNIISIFVDFLPRGMGRRDRGSPFVWEFSIPPKAEDNICYGRAELGSLLKSGVLLDRPFLRVMNFTSALNPTERYIYWSPPSCLTSKGWIEPGRFIIRSWMIDFKGDTFKPSCTHPHQHR